MLMIHALKEKLRCDKKICNSKIAKKSTWKGFRKALKGKKLVLYGAGAMFQYFIDNCKGDIDIQYAVDRKILSDKVIRRAGVEIFPPQKLLEEQESVVVLVTPIDEIDTICADLQSSGIKLYFSLAAMEYHRLRVKCKVWAARVFKTYTRAYEIDRLQNQLKNMQQRVVNMQQREVNMQQKVRTLQQNQAELQLYVAHTNQVLNAVIDKTDDIELKKEQMRYRFFKVRKNAYEPNFENPRTFNEKILAMTLYDHNPLYTEITDKVSFKKYVSERVGEEYVVPLLGVWDTPRDIDFSALPKQFVLKAVGGGDSQNVIIVKNKETEDMADVMQRLESWMWPYKNVYYYNFNWPFKEIKQRIMAEEYIGEEDTEYIYDYKFFVFHGKVEFSYISTVEFANHYPDIKVTYMDKNWEKINVVRNHEDVKIIKKPKFYNKMIELAEVLGEPFDFIRVDFMETEERLYVAELTLTPSGGVIPIRPVELDYEWGKLI